MKTAIILHGMPDKEEYDASPMQTEKHWVPWLKEQLREKGITAHTPEMPVPYKPTYASWKQVFEQFEINEETVLVGHSLGAGFLVRWLSENKVKVGKVMLVAPWMDPDNDHCPEFFDCKIDPKIAERTAGLHIFISDDDESEMYTTVKNIQAAVPNLVLHKFTNKGHFTLEDMGTSEFPELLEVILV